LHVVLGGLTIKAFVAAPKEFNVIGIVRMGLEFGLLATTASGKYVRVNGSRIQRLDHAAVEAAIGVVRASGRGESYAATRMHEAVARNVSTVTHRKRRRVAMVGPLMVAEGQRVAA
jgi:hypothetical protein